MQAEAQFVAMFRRLSPRADTKKDGTDFPAGHAGGKPPRPGSAPPQGSNLRRGAKPV